MKKLTQISEKTSVFVLEVTGDKKEQERLYSLGVLPEGIVTVIKNLKSASPLIIEIDESRLVIARDLAEKIIVTDILDANNLIFNSGHKKTEQRKLILNELKKQHGHFSLDEFTGLVRKKDSKISTITVYRTLKLLTEKGILEVLQMPDGSNKFEIKKGHHDHIICENCGSIIEFYSAEMEVLQEKIAKKYEVELDNHNVKLFVKHCLKCKV
ncbi:MAG: transcriptional repressor [Patescibacteria group bacterium]|nr:transcriptional repressor [Patescibacteria group bacterium]